MPAKGQPFKFEYILHLIRTDTVHQGQSARIALYRNGTRIKMSRQSLSDKTMIRGYLRTHHPMDIWTFERNRLPHLKYSNVYEDELRATYHGEFRSEAHMKADQAARMARSPNPKIRARVR